MVLSLSGSLAMYKFKTISVVIPCYNEEQGLDRMLLQKPSFIDEVVVVDNNSNDNTADVARKHSATIIYERRRGYGWACLAGLSKANGDIIVILDGDDSYPITGIDKLLLYMENAGCDFVTGNRYPLVDKEAQPLINQFANQFMSLLAKVLFKINLKDSQSGMIVLKRGLLDKIKIYNTGMGFSQEIKIKAFIRPDICCGEVHIHYGARTGKEKFRKIEDSTKNICSLLCLWKELQGLKSHPKTNYII